jgi:hypothetical protein
LAGDYPIGSCGGIKGGSNNPPVDNPPPSTGTCARFISGSPAIAPYGLAWDWFSDGRDLLLSLNCGSNPPSITIGKSNTNLPANNAGIVYTWGKSYAYDGTSWNLNNPLSLACNGTKSVVADITPLDSLPDYWCNGTLTGSLPANAAFFVGYSCIYNGTSWKCGCTDTACTNNAWQLQGIKK